MSRDEGQGFFEGYVSLTARLNKAVRENATKEKAAANKDKAKFKGARNQERTREGSR